MILQLLLMLPGWAFSQPPRMAAIDPTSQRMAAAVADDILGDPAFASALQDPAQRDLVRRALELQYGRLIAKVTSGGLDSIGDGLYGGFNPASALTPPSPVDAKWWLGSNHRVLRVIAARELDGSVRAFDPCLWVESDDVLVPNVKGQIGPGAVSLSATHRLKVCPDGTVGPTSDDGPPDVR